MKFERFINSGFYQNMIKLIDIIVLNLLLVITIVFSLGILLASSLTSSFIITKDLLYSSKGEVIKTFYKEIKTNWSFSWRMNLYLLLATLFFIIYGYSVYAFIFIYNFKIMGILYFGVAIAVFILFCIHMINMFIFNSYFGYKKFNYTFRASLLIIAKKRLMTFLIGISFFFFAFITYYLPILGVFFSVVMGIYCIQYISMKIYEQLKREEEKKE